MNLFDKIGFNSSLKGAFDVFGSKMANSLNVATLGKVDYISKAYSSDDGYGMAEIIPIPAWDDNASTKIEGFFFGEKQCKQNDIVLVVFTDRDFSNAIKSQLTTNIPTQNENLHSTQYGVVIKITDEEN